MAIRIPIKVLAKSRGATCKNCGKKNHFVRVRESKRVDKLYKKPITGSNGTLDYDYDFMEIDLYK